MYTYIHIRIYMYIHINTCKYVHIHIHEQAFIPSAKSNTISRHQHIHTYIHTYIHTNTFITISNRLSEVLETQLFFERNKIFGGKKNTAGGEKKTFWRGGHAGFILAPKTDSHSENTYSL